MEQESIQLSRTPVYLDSNVIIDMADGREDELIGLILRSIYNGPYCYPFSAEQISEITQQEKPERNQQRLVFLADISRSLYLENSLNYLGFKLETTVSVHATLNEAPMALEADTLFANMVTHEQQREARNAYGLSSENLNNLSAQDAIKAIEAALTTKDHGGLPGNIQPPRSLTDFLRHSAENMSEHFPDLTNQPSENPELIAKNNDYVGLFSLIDTFGFWSDLKKTYVKGSRLADSRHAFIASFCAKVVSRDKRFLKKAEAAYSYFGLATETMSTEEFKSSLKTIL
ncbi:hypothetical protein D8Y20_08605 [Mariprofundus sp. EBB-1]|uniref:hypothetical protein n=1 Tax=Mariprofundus sp. EBB-1 TaxID=2650971 RepID=UPI000EF20AF6|nr:hypothetical protein [Mariprofundus sp. EBB-1]RLL51738.1 hypothetical protein D8Y20_08605 [Mariprofundus sp. EBB-1]